MDIVDNIDADVLQNLVRLGILQPRLFSCMQHMFCLKCLEYYCLLRGEGGRSVPCPVCSEFFAVSTVGVSQIKTTWWQSPSLATSQVLRSINIVQMTYNERQYHRGEGVIEVIHATNKSNFTTIILQVWAAFNEGAEAGGFTRFRGHSLLLEQSH